MSCGLRGRATELSGSRSTDVQPRADVQLSGKTSTRDAEIHNSRTIRIIRDMLVYNLKQLVQETRPTSPLIIYSYSKDTAHEDLWLRGMIVTWITKGIQHELRIVGAINIRHVARDGRLENCGDVLRRAQSDRMSRCLACLGWRKGRLT